MPAVPKRPGKVTGSPNKCDRQVLTACHRSVNKLNIYAPGLVRFAITVLLMRQRIVMLPLGTEGYQRLLEEPRAH